MQVGGIIVEKYIDNPSAVRTGTQLSLFIPRTIGFHDYWVFLKDKYNLSLLQVMCC